MATYPIVWSPRKAGTPQNEDFRIRKAATTLNLMSLLKGQRRPDLEVWLNAKPRHFEAKMFQTRRERCPVALFRQYISRRPPNVRASGPFYRSIKYNRRRNADISWNKINSIIRNIISGTTLESSEKRFSNHSVSKTLVSKMKKTNFERSSIAKVTSHRNIQSLDDYDEADEKEQRQLLWAISKGNSTLKSMPAAGSSSGTTSRAIVPHMMSSQAENLINIPSQTALSHSTTTARPRLSLNRASFDSISSQVIQIQTEQLHELFSRTLNCFFGFKTQKKKMEKLLFW